jgi:WD40-like Beta Propeller Repeat
MIPANTTAANTISLKNVSVTKWPLQAAIVLLGSLALGQPPAVPIVPTDAPKPEMIGEGIISTPDDEFGGSLSPDGNTVYYDVTAPPHYLYVICQSRLVDGKWQKPEVMPFSGQYRDSDPVLTPDGKTLLFASDRPRNGVPSENFYIWASKKVANGWSAPQVLDGTVNSAGSQVFASMANNGNIYFTSTRKTGQFDIYRSRLQNGKYQEAESLGSPVNEEGVWSLEALIAPDESYLLIGSFGRQPGFGNSDLFISYNQNGVWTKPKNLGPVINTAAREYSPRISPDGKWLIYTSEQGMQIEKRDQPFTAHEFSEKSRGIWNGLGNIYRIPMEYVLRETRP